MNTETLHLALQQSFSADANLRIPAEETIKNLKHVDGATTMLLQVAGEPQVSSVYFVMACVEINGYCNNSFLSSIKYYVLSIRF